MWKSIKHLYKQAFDFEYSDDDEHDCSDDFQSSSNDRRRSLSTSPIQREDHGITKIPCQFCSILLNESVLFPHQISCSHNPANRIQTPTYRGPALLPDRVSSSANLRFTDITTLSNASLVSINTDSLHSLQCPITCEIFVDPVIAEDGITYERSAIKRWIEQNGSSPMTRELMTVAGIRPNLAIKNAVEEFRTRSTNSNQQSSSRIVRDSFDYELNVDVKKTTELPFTQTIGKSLFHAEWTTRRSQQDKLVLLHITGDRAVKEAKLNTCLPPHPHIVRTLGLVKHNGDGMLLLQEFAKKGNLSDLLRVERSPPSSRVIHGIILQIVDALIFLTQQGVIHSDLACRNILVFQYDPIQVSRNLVKLTDFGISRSSGAVTSLDIVAVLSSAPEVLRIKAYSEKSDVWALAVLAWEIYSSGTTPMIRQISRDFIENDGRILAGERLLRPPACSTAQWAIFLECMKQDPNQRPTFIQLRDKLLIL